jgi:arsenate reductase
MTAFPITIYHNPKCGTSRNTLAFIESAGYAPQVVEYMKTGWNKAQLKDLLKAMNACAQDILRAKEPLADELGLKAADVSEERLLEAMVAHPVLVNRPIVVTPKGAKLCRPAENVLPLLDKQPTASAPEGAACSLERK